MAQHSSDMKAIAARYVAALFALACEKNKQEQVARDLVALASAIESSTALQRVIDNPMLPLKQKAAAFAEVLAALKADSFTSELVQFVIMNKRAHALGAIAAAYQQALIAHQGALSATVATAHPLGEAQQKRIAEALKAAAGKPVQLTCMVKPELIGGLVIKMGSRMLDRSVAGTIQRLKASLGAAAV